MMTETATPSTSTISTERFTGRVKWFNNKAGYGFVTVTDGDKSGTDVFVHHSTIKVGTEQYKYLVQGEYIEFSIVSTDGGKHAYQAGDVSGIRGGKLMCETRREFKVARTSYRSSEEPVEPTSYPPTQRSVAPRARGEGPRDSEWTVVGNQTPVTTKPSAKRGRPPKSSSSQTTTA